MLEQAMVKTQAWECLQDPQQCGRLNMEELSDTMIRAGYRPEAARKAALQRGWDRLSVGQAL